MLRDIIGRATERLRAAEETRDRVYPKARRARTLSKQAILTLHRGDPAEARRLVAEAADLLAEILGAAADAPDIQGSETVAAARQEYAEAAILIALVTEGRYPPPEELRVAETDYILGLADVTGELRRQALDHLRAGDLMAAEQNLETMEEIYLYLIEAEEASMMLKGMRRKLDVAHGVIERTRAEITAEAGRRRLSKELGSFRDRLES